MALISSESLLIEEEITCPGGGKSYDRLESQAGGSRSFGQ